jgi:hypothetical protein
MTIYEKNGGKKMRTIRKFSPVVCAMVVCLFLVQPALADVPTDVWVEVELLSVQTGMQGDLEDTRLLCTATDESFENTWLIVDRDAANMVAATALTAFSLGYNVRIRIVTFGTGFRVEKIRVLQP